MNLQALRYPPSGTDINYGPHAQDILNFHLVYAVMNIDHILLHVECVSL